MKTHRSIYDGLAKRYDEFLLPLEKFFLSNWRNETLSFLPEDTAILEVGTGTGLNFRFYPKSKLAVGLDLSLQMLHQAIHKNKDIFLVQADAENLPFEDNYFDAVFATLFLCSVKNPQKALQELRRVVKSDGRIILLEHVRPKGLLGYVFDFLNFFTERFLHDCFNRRISQLLNESGIEVLKISEKAFGIVNLIICKKP